MSDSDASPVSDAVPDGSALLSRYDPFDSKHVQNPDAAWERSRQNCPVFWSEPLNAWVVTSYEAVRSVIANPATYVNDGANAPVTPPPEPVTQVLAEGVPAREIRPTFTRDGTDHARIRRFLIGVLTPRYISALEPHIRELADSLVDQMADEGHADFVSAFAYRLPLAVILDLFGVTGASYEQIHQWTTQTMSLFWGKLTIDEHLAAARSYLEFQQFLHGLVERARAGGKDNVVSRLATLDTGQDERLSDGEIVGLLLGLISAGHETSANLMSLTLLQALRQREIWQLMIENPKAIPGVI